MTSTVETPLPPATILPAGIPTPMTSPDGLDAPFWEATRRHELVAQRCCTCDNFQWGPEWICHRCLSFDLTWEQVEPVGRVFSYERVWHPVHPALASGCPYVTLLVELPHANGIRMLGNRVGNARQPVTIGSTVHPVFEDHNDSETPFTLVQWRCQTQALPANSSTR